MKPMRTAMILLAVCPLTAIIDARPSGAETYRPWCVQYSGRSGARSCAFTSFEQCMMTAGPGTYAADQPYSYKATAGKSGTAKTS